MALTDKIREMVMQKTGKEKIIEICLGKKSHLVRTFLIRTFVRNYLISKGGSYYRGMRRDA